MKKHFASEEDRTMPMVQMNKSPQQQLQRKRPPPPPKYAVINVEDIIHQVGLIQTLISETKFNVIAPYYVFRKDMQSTAGNIINL